MWLGKVGKRGYGKTKVWDKATKKQKDWLVHRLAYTTWVGVIPDCLTVDHTCFNKLCINPNHLEPVTLVENNRRYIVKDQLERTTFGCGHPRWGENRKQVGVKSKGKLSPRKVRTYGCRQCNDAYMKAYLKDYLPKWRARRAAANNLH